MEIGILQLFWLVIILVIFIASVVKRYISAKKSRDRLSKENVGNMEEVKRIRPERQQGRPEWEDFMSDMFGIEPIRVKSQKPLENVVIRTKKTETEEKKYADEKMEELTEQGMPEFHATIEDRHIKSKIEEDVLKPSVSEPHVVSASFESGQESKPEIEGKKIKAMPYNIFKENGLKDAIIYSEIIGLPIGLRKRSILRHIR